MTIAVDMGRKATQTKSTEVLQYQGSKIALVHSYLQVPQAAGHVKILIFLVKINFSLNMSIIFVIQDKCLF